MFAEIMIPLWKSYNYFISISIIHANRRVVTQAIYKQELGKTDTKMFKNINETGIEFLLNKNLFVKQKNDIPQPADQNKRSVFIDSFVIQF